MGMFDNFHIPGECLQRTQCKNYNNTLEVFHFGDTVINDKLPKTHSVRLQCGKWVNILNDVYTSYSDSPETTVLYNKWGQPIDETFRYKWEEI